MKKVLAILLAVVITVSLCACSGDTTYQALTDALASGDYASVQAELSSLSPDYKAEQEKLSAYRENYGTLIDALEAEDYGTAQENLTSRIPTEPEPEYTYVDITLDNWQEYFEMEQGTEWETNAFDEIEFKGNYLYLTVKEEYRDKLPHFEIENLIGEPSSVCYTLDEQISVEYKYSFTFYGVTVYPESKAVIRDSSKGTHQGSDATEVNYFSDNDGNSAYLGGSSLVNSSGEIIAYSYFDSYEITAIEGKLPLLVE